jgi:energy-coupling factor transport system substrate-specific component
VLNKPQRLTSEEFDTMKAHVEIGGNILKPINGLKGLADGALYHHEWFDGKGYPHGLKGKDIPLIGRIVAVADSFDTIITARAYKAKRATDAAFAELLKCSGTQFDPEIVDAFYSAFKKGKINKREYISYDFSKLH